MRRSAAARPRIAADRSTDARALPQSARDTPQPLARGHPRRDRCLSLPTLRRRLAAIASRHAVAGLESLTDDPLVRKLLRRYSRSRGTAVKKKEALLIERLPAILMAMPEDLPALRDRALLLLGMRGRFGAASSSHSTSRTCAFRSKGYTCGSRPPRTTRGRRGASSTCPGSQ